jgi:hypothetical protein
MKFRERASQTAMRTAKPNEIDPGNLLLSLPKERLKVSNVNSCTSLLIRRQ